MSISKYKHELWNKIKEEWKDNYFLLSFKALLGNSENCTFSSSAGSAFKKSSLSSHVTYMKQNNITEIQNLCVVTELG